MGTALFSSSFGCSSKPTLETADGAASGDASAGPGSDGGVGSTFDAAMWGNVQAVPVACGSLDPATAAQLVLTRVDDILLPAAEALGMIDTSTTLARFFATPGPSPTTISFGSNTKTAVNNLADTLSEQWLVASNVESVGGGQVTYLLNHASDEGGTEAAVPPCGSTSPNQQLRLVVSRIDCAEGDNVEVELDAVLGTEKARLLAFELYSNRIYGRLFLGDWINLQKQLTESSCSAVSSADGGWVTTSTTTVATVFDPGATGVLAGEVDVADGGAAHAVLSVVEPLAIGWTQSNGGAHASVAVASDEGAVDVTVDPNAGTIVGSLGAGVETWTTTLAGFVEGFFNGRTLVGSANPNEPVAMSVPGLTGSFAYTSSGDTVAFTGVGINNLPALALHGSDALMRVTVAPGSEGRASVVATTGAVTGVDLAFTAGFSLGIDYGLANIASEVVSLPPYAQKDVLSVTLGGQNPSVVTLLPAQSLATGPQLAIFSYGARTLFEVQSGQLDLTSSFVPTENVHVGVSQCLLETGNQTSNGDGLEDLAAGSCF